MSEDTPERSLAHWSEAGRAGMEAFYALASADYAHLAAAQDWRGWLEAAQEGAEAGARPLRLLDVACGSGKFPAALLRDSGLGDGALRPIAYDLLDPSPFSLTEARSALRPPFEPAASHETTLQDFRPSPRPYDVVWATHALYAIPAADLPAAAATFVAAIAPGGRGFIAHAEADSFYLRFDDAFSEAFRGGGGASYRDAAEVVAALEAAGARVTGWSIAYRQEAAFPERATVEGFLRRCAFDDGPTLEQMETTEPVASLLAECRGDGAWRFPQHVRLIFVEGGA